MAAALGNCTHQLRVLHIELATIALSSADLDSLLANVPNLQLLNLDFRNTPACWDARGAVLVHTISRLPVSQLFRIRTSSLFDLTPDNRPTVVDLAALSSAQLTCLDLNIETSSKIILSFGALLALTTFRLGGCGEADHHPSALLPYPLQYLQDISSVPTWHRNISRPQLLD